MKKKYIDALFIGLVIYTITNFTFLDPSLVNKVTATESIPSELPAFMDSEVISHKKTIFHELNTMDQDEKNTFYNESHKKYPKLVDALLHLRSNGFITYDDILNIHKSIEDYELNKPTEVPYTDKDLLEYLYDNSIITKAQLEQILNLMDNED